MTCPCGAPGSIVKVLGTRTVLCDRHDREVQQLSATIHRPPRTPQYEQYLSALAHRVDEQTLAGSWEGQQ